ncbi:MAG: phosphoadenylyl-sulfate reductase [Rhodobacteraceae bacterium]|nr:phosphoadenylyl-sulfate reductase [Paracoccaceae bacterium]
MPLEAPLAPAAERVAELNARYKAHSATAVLRHALSDPQVGDIAMVSSFGAESVALLHMLSRVDRSVPVLFLDTQMLFAETLEYQKTVTEILGLTDVRVLTPDRSDVFLRDPDGDLHVHYPDACCALRKVEPLERALSGFDAWITGRKRFQGGTRTEMDFFETDGKGRIKVNPLAHWTREDVREYMINNRLPRHPLVAQGYPSLGCAPCTSPVADGEDERAGRWRGVEKVECGIHFIDGKVVRGKLPGAVA